ncbi:PREDICTED: transcription activator MSS11 isoform X3 [Drosophila arizonae]|uniref:Transcription activator MSS11 isoform X3 n=1 Tax=Drosophila arizonae TaxID=7263 RepID=A0ABM1NXX3_DROAR|nr:PREDICTED: transcription activator MSS11 isoform X3 [Drosophila arizonae]
MLKRRRCKQQQQTTQEQQQQQYQQQHQQQQQNVPISQHDELIRYIREAWNKVSEQGEIYCNESDNQLKNFKPFNLEEYWGQRLVQNIHVTTTHQ